MQFNNKKNEVFNSSKYKHISILTNKDSLTDAKLTGNIEALIK